MSKVKLNITVTKNASGEVAPQAAIAIFSQDNQPPQWFQTDASGKANQLIDTGRYQVVGLHDSLSVLTEITVLEDTSLDLKLFKIRSEHNELAGKKFFWTLIQIFSGLLLLYLLCHIPLWTNRVVVDGASLSKVGAQIKDNLATINNETINLVEQFPALETKVTVLKSTVSSLETTLTEIPGFGKAAFWQTEPLQLLEIVFWALFGVLSLKIIESGIYLFQKRFFEEGVKMHIANLFTTPLIVIVTVNLLSLVNLDVADSTLNINFQDSRVLIALAFILGSRPWSVWRFITQRGDQLVVNSN